MEKGTADDSLTTPSWLNFKFLSDVLSNDKETGISVIDFKVSAAVPKGNNYLSTLYRVVAQYKKINEENTIKKCSLIIKTLPVGDLMQEIVSNFQAFEKETCMYEKVLPSIYKLMNEITGRIHPLSAQCLPCQVEKTIVLEDMQILGYKMANRHIGLDLDHCKVTVRALARFHAYALKLYKSDPYIVDNFAESWYVTSQDKREVMEKRSDINLRALAAEIEGWRGFEHYAEKVIKTIPKLVDVMIEAVTAKKGKLNVLNHGDCWTNNMMFRYCPTTGKVKDVRFVDFQMARFASPAVDLQYFMCLCPSDEVRFDHREELLEEYHSEFSNTLEILKLDPSMLTLHQLKDDFAEKDGFGMFTAFTVLVAVVADVNEVPDLDEVTEDPAKEGKSLLGDAYGGKRYREIIQKLLPFYEKKGLL